MELEKLTQKYLLQIDTSGFKNFANQMNETGKSMNRFGRKLDFKNGDVGLKTLYKGFSGLDEPIKRTETAVDRLGRTLANSFRYSVVNHIMDNVLAQAGDVTHFLKETDKNLNNIRIVSNKTAAEMVGFTKTGLSQAKDMGRVTNDYLKASEIYYQQGLSTEEVMKRTEATVKASSISGQSVSSTANQATAILNGFNIEANQTVEVLDKIAQVGAGTATDFEEIAKASQKMASAASQANFTIDQSLGMIATISSVTREAPETIGTSLNALIGRFNNLKVDKNGEYASLIEKAFKTTGSGLTIFGENGELKEVPKILDEVAEKWENLTINAQKTIASAIAGTRQANKLMALLSNYDKYKEYTEMSENSKGALDAQNKIYLESLEAIKNQAEASKEALYNELFNVNALKEWYSWLSKILDGLTSIVGKTGGLEGVLGTFGALAAKPLFNALAPTITRSFQKNFYSKGIEKEYDTRRANIESSYNSVFQNPQDQIKLLSAKELSISLSEQEQAEYRKAVDLLSRQALIQTHINELKKEENRRNSINAQLIQETSNKMQVESAIKSLQKAASFDKYLNIDFGVFDSKKTLGGLTDHLPEVGTLIENRKREIANEYKIIGKDRKKTDSIKDIAELDALEAELDQTMAKISEVEKAWKRLTSLLTTKNFPDIENTDRLQGDLYKTPEYKNIIASFSKMNANQQANFLKQIESDTGIKPDFGLENLSEAQLQKVIPSANSFLLNQRKEIPGLRKDITNLQSEFNENNKKAGGVKEWVNSLAKSAKMTSNVEKLTTATFGLSGAYRALKVAADDSLTSNQKLEGVISALGSSLAMIPGPIGAIGMALSVLGPIFLEVTGIGKSEIEKTRKTLDNVQKTTENFTKTLNQQVADLHSVEGAYNTLAKTYQTTGLNLKSLTEEQRTQYSQVSDYAEKYAPELIKYYDAEGRAVLDLTKAYGDAELGRKSYLRTKADQDQYMIFSSIKKDANPNAELINKNYALALQEVEEIKGRIQSLRQEGLATGVDFSEKIGELSSKLAEHQQILNNIASQWNDLVVKPTLYGSGFFQSLSSESQNSLIDISSYNNYQSSKLGQEEFLAQIEVIDIALASLTDKAALEFSAMSDSARRSILNLGIELQMTGEQLDTFLNQIHNQDDFLSGTFLTPDFTDSLTDSKYSTFQNASQNLKGMEEDTESYTNMSDSWLLDNMDSNTPLQKRVELNVEVKQEALEEAEEKLDDLESRVRAYKDDVKGISKNNVSSVEDLSEDDYKEYAKAQVFDEIGDQIRDFAAQSEENFNAVGKNYEKLVDKINKAKVDPKIMDKEQVKDTQRMADELYSVLMGNNKDYFKKFKEMNASQLKNNEEMYGIDASNYETLNDYKNAIDAESAKYKTLLDQATTMTAEELNIKAAQIYQQTKANELMAAGQTAAGKVMMAVTGANSEEQINAAYTDYVLQNLETQLTSKGTASNASLNIIQGELQAAGNMNSSYANQIAEMANNLAGATIAKGGTISIAKGGNQAMVDAIKALRTKLKKEMGDAKVDQGKLDAINGIMNKYLGALEGGYNLPSAGSLGAPSFGGGGLPDISSNKPSGSGGGGGGGGGGKGSGKEVEDLELELDPLKRINDLLAQQEHELNLLQEQKELAYGNKYLEYLDRENNLQKKNIELQNQKLDKIKEIEKEQQEELKKKGVEFDENGLIVNYNELLLKKQKEANALKGEEKEKAKDAVEDLQDAMDKYEEDVIDQRREALESIQDIKSELADLASEKFEYMVELIVNSTDDASDLIEFLKESERYKKGKINFSVSTDESAKQLINTMNGIKDIFNHSGDANKFVNDVLNDPALKDATSKQMEILKERQEQMQKLGSDLLDFANELGEAFGEGLDEAVDIIQEEFEKYENITNQYEYILDLADKLNLKSSDNINDLYSNMSSIYTNNIAQMKNALNVIKKTRDSFDKGSEEWIAANQKYLEMQSTVIEKEQALAELLENKYDDVVKANRKDLEKILFGGMTEEDVQKNYKEMTKERNKFLDTEEKIYQLSKMERTITKEINKYQYDPESQLKLKNFMDKELRYLKDKEHVSKNDLDLSMKQYEVLKARIELERAYNNEQYKMMLQRNEDGTFGYLYVQNTDKIEQAKQKYEDAVNALYEFTKKRSQQLQDETLNIRSNTLKEYDSILDKLKKGIITEEDATSRLNKVFEKMKKDLTENAKAQAEMQQQLSSAKLLQILGVSEAELSDLATFEDKITKIFNILDENGEVKGIEKVFKSLGVNVEKYSGTIGEKIAQVYKDLGGNEEALEKMIKAFGEADDSTATTVLGLLKDTGNLAEITNKILEESLAGEGEKFDELLKQITSGMFNTKDIFEESFKNNLTELEELWENVKKVTQANLDELNKQFDASNPNSPLSNIKSNILSAYKEWQNLLKESYEESLKRKEELQESTDEYNKHLEDTLNKTDKELEQLVELTKKYAGLREEILKTIDEVTKYIDIINKAKATIDKNNGVRTVLLEDSQYSTSLYKNKTSKVVDNHVQLEGEIGGYSRIKTTDGQIGWVSNDNLRSATNNTVLNRKALLENDRSDSAIIESQTNFIEKLQNLVTAFENPVALNEKSVPLNNNNNNQEIHINASFPNATDSKEIQEAFESLLLNSSQYINKK